MKYTEKKRTQNIPNLSPKQLTSSTVPFSMRVHFSQEKISLQKQEGYK